MQGVWPHGVNHKHKERVWPGADIALVILEMFFGLAFTLEVLFKCGLDIRRFVKSLWNWFDTLVVGFWILSVSARPSECGRTQIWDGRPNPAELGLGTTARIWPKSAFLIVNDLLNLKS